MLDETLNNINDLQKNTFKDEPIDKIINKILYGDKKFKILKYYDTEYKKEAINLCIFLTQLYIIVS